MIHVIANWKMHKNREEVLDFIQKIAPFLEENLNSNACAVSISPPTIHLPLFLFNNATPYRENLFNIVAQNIFHKESGAYTGETSVSMISNYVDSVIIGHSERRKYFHETNEVLLNKLSLCFKYKLKPIFCFGEKLKNRNEGDYLSVIQNQLEHTILSFNKSDILNSIFAYEPVWAIGTGKNANSNQIIEVHNFVRNLIAKKLGSSESLKIPILYGGSCTSENAKSILSQQNVNGLLVGGASLDCEHFVKIIKIAHELF